MTSESFASSGSRVTWREVGRLLRRREFLALVGTRVMGQIGDGMVQAALTSFVLFSPEQQATPMKIAIAFGILLLPYSLFGPFVGVLIDRWSRQRILIASALTRALTVALIAVVVTTGDEGWLLGITVLISLGVGRFLLATLAASLPHVVRDRELVTANAFAPTAGTMSTAVGGLFGIAIGQMAGKQGTLLSLGMAAVFQLCAALVAATLERNSLGPERIVRDVRAQMHRVALEIAAGWRHLAAQSDAWRAMVVVVMHRSALGMMSVGAIVLSREALSTGSGITELAITVGGAAAGAFIGAVLAPVMVGRIGINRWTARVLVIGATGSAVFVSWVVADPHSPYAAAILCIAGGWIGWVGQSVKVCCDAVIQYTIDDNHRGRVFSIYDMAVNVGLFSGIMLAATLLPSDGRSYLIAAYAAGILLLALRLLRLPPRK